MLNFYKTFFDKLFLKKPNRIYANKSFIKVNDHIMPRDLTYKDQKFLKNLIQNNFSMTSPTNLFHTFFSVSTLLKNNIPGDFVETGTFAGGHSIIIGYLLKKFKSNRKVYIYDTFSGMPEPNFNEIRLLDKVSAKKIIEESEFNKCKVDLKTVKENILKMNISLDSFIFIKGKTQDTLNKFIPENEIAFVRMDTDWYESSKKEVESFWPRLSQNGILIIDDYAYWSGQKKAVDEFFSKNRIKKFSIYIDGGSRMFIKN